MMLGFAMPERPGPMRSESDGESSEPWTRGRWFAAIAVLLVIAASGALLTYRSAEDEWPWSTYPNLLHACGRHFVPEGGWLSRADWVTHGEVLVRVAGRVQGMFNHGALWAIDSTPGPLPGGCQMEIWVQGRGDAFRRYVLSGGP